MKELISYLNENYDDGENVPGWEISPVSFENAVKDYGLEITERVNLTHHKGEVWQFVNYKVSDGITEKAIITRTAW